MAAIITTPDRHPIGRGSQLRNEEHDQQGERQRFFMSEGASDLEGFGSGFASNGETELNGEGKVVPHKACLDAQVRVESMSSLPRVDALHFNERKHDISPNIVSNVVKGETSNNCSYRNRASEFSGRSCISKTNFSRNSRRHMYRVEDNYCGAHYVGRPTVEYHPYGRNANFHFVRNESWPYSGNQSGAYTRNQSYFYDNNVPNRDFRPWSQAANYPGTRNDNNLYSRDSSSTTFLWQSTPENYTHARRLIDHYGCNSYGRNMVEQQVGIRHNMSYYDHYAPHQMDVNMHPYRGSIDPYHSYQARDHTSVEANASPEVRNQSLQDYLKNPTRSSYRHAFDPTMRSLDLRVREKTYESNRSLQEVMREHIYSSNGTVVNDGKTPALLVPLGRQLMHTSCRKLLVLDINGLLADVTSDVNLVRKEDTKVRRKAVFRRPFCIDFLNFCFEKFDVGIWSSRLRRNVDSLVDFLLGEAKHRLQFYWDASHCTSTGFVTIENAVKPLVLKDLRKLWDNEASDLPWSKGYYSPSNTLLVDDSPYKALCNPPHTAIFPKSYHYTDNDDSSLGPGGDLRVYLEGLALADNVQDYVRSHPYGQRAITTEDPNWNFYKTIVDKFKHPAIEHVNC